MSVLRKIIFLLSVLSMAAVLTCLSFFQSYVLQISVEPRSPRVLEMRRDNVIVVSNGNEPVFFDIAGDVSNPNISKVSVSVRPPNKADFEKRGDFKVSRGSFLGALQLGSAESPITSDENYPYTIDSGDDNTRLSEGNIQVRVKAVIPFISRGWMMIIAGIGLLASVLQVFQFLRPDSTLRSLPENSPTPATAKE